MTVNDMLLRVTQLLGYSDLNGDIGPTTKLLQRAMAAMNSVYADLFNIIRPQDTFYPLTSPDDEIRLNQRALTDVMPYGVAAFLAQSENDGDQQQFYITLYNSKRNTLTRSDIVTDNIPIPE